MEPDQFQLKSREFKIFPKYDNSAANNFDICLVKMPMNEYGIHDDLSAEFDDIPCLPNEIDLNEVCS